MHLVYVIVSDYYIVAEYDFNLSLQHCRNSNHKFTGAVAPTTPTTESGKVNLDTIDSRKTTILGGYLYFILF